MAQQQPHLILAASNAGGIVKTQSARRQGQVLADILKDRDITGVAVTYISDAYGKALETAFANAFKAHGGRIAISISHRDGKDDYFAEVGALAAAGVEHLVVLGVLDHGGLGIVQTALDTGAFEKFVLGEGMIGEQLIQAVGSDLDGSIAALPDYAELGSEFLTSQTVVPSADDDILPGALVSAVDVAKSTNQVDLGSSTSLPIAQLGEVPGTYRELEIKNGKFETVKIR
jgi:branched-chain amino acid transport system substrate-binding protein